MCCATARGFALAREAGDSSDSSGAHVSLLSWEEVPQCKETALLPSDYWEAWAVAGDRMGMLGDFLGLGFLLPREEVLG